jgi:hypothetical protein
LETYQFPLISSWKLILYQFLQKSKEEKVKGRKGMQVSVVFPGVPGTWEKYGWIRGKGDGKEKNTVGGKREIDEESDRKRENENFGKMLNNLRMTISFS